MITTINAELAAAITDVVNELATELDLHYENTDVVATGPTISKMQTLVEMLVASGHPVPEDYTHISNRYRLAIN